MGKDFDIFCHGAPPKLTGQRVKENTRNIIIRYFPKNVYLEPAVSGFAGILEKSGLQV
jgi:hypothetical protein